MVQKAVTQKRSCEIKRALRHHQEAWPAPPIAHARDSVWTIINNEPEPEAEGADVAEYAGLGSQGVREWSAAVQSVQAALRAALGGSGNTSNTTIFVPNQTADSTPQYAPQYKFVVVVPNPARSLLKGLARHYHFFC